jgi:hypothetical protein
MTFLFTFLDYLVRIEVKSLPAHWYSLCSPYPDPFFRKRSRLKDLAAFFCGAQYRNSYYGYVFPSEEALLHFAFLFKAETHLTSRIQENWRYQNQRNALVDEIPF